MNSCISHRKVFTRRRKWMCGLVLGFLALTLSVPASPAVSAGASAKARRELDAWLAEPRLDRSVLSKASFSAVPLTRDDAASALAALWKDHADYLRETRRAELQAKVIELDGVKMKFQMLSFTNRAATNGRSLFISMHGGGNGPHEMNESQYVNQVRLGQAYHPSEGIYLAPRAPTDDWDLWHKPHIDALFARLIEDLVVLADVNPDRVYLLGYSAGGDGVYQLAPRMADRWAGAAMMAGHPNDVSPLGLRNVPFAIQVGANDSGYNRNKVAAEWGGKLDALEKADPGGYVHFTELHEGKGHWMDLEDRKAIPWMEKFTRNPLPDKVVWWQAGVAHDRFYWLARPANEVAKGQVIRAERAGQIVTLTSTNAHTVTVLFNDRMVNLDEPVEIQAGGKTLLQKQLPRTIATLARTLYEHGDTNLAFSAEATVILP